MLGLSLPLISCRITHVLFTLCVFVYVTNDAWLVFTSNFLLDDSYLIYVMCVCVRSKRFLVGLYL